MPPDRDGDIFEEPLVDITVMFRFCWCRSDEVELISLQEGSHRLLCRTHGFAVLITQSTDVDINDRALSLFLAVVYPADNRYNGMHERVVVHPMLSMETDSGRIVLVEKIVGVDCGVLVSE